MKLNSKQYTEQSHKNKKIIADATLASTAMRIFLLDKAIKFTAPREKKKR